MPSRSPQLRVIARTERRRFWWTEKKRATVAENLPDAACVSTRFPASSPAQLFTWERQMLVDGGQAARQ